MTAAATTANGGCEPPHAHACAPWVPGCRGDLPQPVPAAYLPAVAPATHWVREWCEYRLVHPDADELRVGARSVERLYADCFGLRFANRLGLARLQFLRRGTPLGEPLWVEVISAKVGGVEEHLDFCATLLDNLYLRAARLPFTVEGATARGAAEARRPPSPLFTLHYLCHHAASLLAALTVVLRSPHRALTAPEQMVDLASVSEVGPDTVLSIIESPEELDRSSHLALARRLRGLAPRHVLQYVAQETFDTPENRFVLAFARSLVQAAEVLPTQRWWGSVSTHRRRLVTERSEQLRRASRHSVFEGVGEMQRMPASSQVLMRREGYRELRELWQLFQQARRPLFGPMQQAIELRDVATMYEFWVFFRLAEDIGALLGQEPVLKLAVSDSEGLRHRARAVYGRGLCLWYSRGFGQGAGGSYSVPLRPDYTWFVDGQPRVALDAKFRMSAEGLRCVDAESADEEDAVRAQSVAEREDLHKMHTYRDALGLRAAVALYPGDETVFYASDARGHRDVRLAEVLLGDLQGIGALPMRPGS